MKLKKALCTLPLLGIFLLPFGYVRAADEIAINSTNFPGYIDGRDAVWVIKEYDTDKNGSLSSEEIASCTSLKWSFNDDNYGALYKMTALQELDLSSWSENGLTFDPGKFPQLTSLKLDAHKGKVQVIDLSQCIGLKKLRVGHYGGESLDISYCKDLEEFELEYGSTLDHVDFTKNTKLKVIHCSYINDVNLSKNTALVDLRLDTADTVLDLSNCANLKKLDIKSLKIKDLRLSSKANLEWFEFYANNNGQAYDLSKHTNLTHLSLKSADLKTTDFTKLTKLQYLCVQGSRFKDNILDLTKMPDLEYLSVSQCYMTSLDLSKNTKLTNLYCDSAAITHLDLSHNTALTTLNCSSIDLDELVLTKNTNLTDLYCTGNKTVLNELDLTANSALKSIWVSNFKNVKIGNCPNLGTLSASANTETLDLGYCPILHNMYLTKNNIKTVDLSNCPLYIRATDNFESVVSDTEVRTTGTLSVTYNGKTSDMSCIFSLAPSIQVITDKISIAGSFPDAKLSAYVSEVADKNKDGILSKDEIAAVVTFNCSGKGIADLTGLEVFNNIETLDCSHNALTSVNANAFPKLKKLICSDNQLTNDTLVTDKVGLVYLDCSYNKLTVLEKRNQDTLETIKISHNELKSSSLYNYKKLRHLEINDNQLKSFMLTANIEYLDCSNNLIESMVMLNDEGKALKTLNCSNNKLSYLDLENCEGLESLKAYGNVFSAYPIQLNRNMSDLYPDRVEKKVDGVDCVVFGDKYFFDVGTKFRYFLKIDEKNFPDAGLRKALAKYDTDSDGYYNELERKIDKLDCSGYQIKDLTGLKLLRVDNLDCSFNDLSELNIMDLTTDDNVIDIVTCYGNPKLKSVVVYKVFTALGPQYVTKSEKTATVNVGGKDVTIDYDCYTAFGALMMNVDRGVRLVGDPVNISVIVPEGAGIVTGDGLNEKDTDVTLEFKPADGVTFSGWVENGKLVSTDLTLTITTSEAREFTIACTMPQTLVFENTNIKKTAADKPFTVEVSGAKTAVVYSSSNTKVAKVEPSTGKVTLIGIGECTITAKAGASDLYKEASTSYKLVVVAAPTATPTATPKPTATSAPKVTDTPKVTAEPEPTAVPEDPKAQILAFVERIYIYVLNREPEEEGAAFWSDELYSFRRTGAEVAQGFIFSDEFVNRNTSDKEFVTILYKTFFGRDPEEEGMNFWLNQLATGTMDRFTVANGFIYSQEWADTCASYGIRSGGDLKPTGKIAPTELTYAFVERMYTTALGRGYDEEGKQYWASELANFNMTGEFVGAAFFLSDEMNGYNLNDKEYLGRLYATFMNREPDSDGEAYWLSQMSAGVPRADIVFGFTRSPEFTDKCIEARILPY